MKKNVNYVAIDLETTGLNPKMDSIIEIGAVKFIDGKVEDTLETFVKPGKKLSERITELTGISQEEADKGIELEEAIELVLEFVDGFPILGHSILFDYTFLKRAAVNKRLTFEAKGIDTLKLARKYLPELPSKRLPDLCAHYGITYRAHRALEDAKAAAFLYERLAKEFWEEESFRPCPLVCRIKRETPITKHQKERLYELIAKHKLSVDFDVEKLTRNQASRYTDQILSKYGRC